MRDLFSREETERLRQRNARACRWIREWLRALDEGREVWMVETCARVPREIYNQERNEK